MKVENVSIARRESYDADYPNMLVGTVQFKGPDGKMEVKLSNAVVAQVFSLIKSDCQRVANLSAQLTEHAIEEAENETPLLEAAGFEEDKPF